ncbi:unnamed protein product [Somion occarium]|uniref:NAD-P-binding protein n=1 Tax=Somion occarium TaxID=3059160 RepID=A0ABP1DIT5_9APHY
MAAARVWFITGAGSGFGKLVAELALQHGDHVVATSRTSESLVELQSKFPSDQLLTIRLDVSRTQEIQDGFAAAREKFGRIDVVFNNAGYAIAGELECIPIPAAREVFDVDFWGSAQVSLEAVKFFREVNAPGVGGRLLVTGSLTGVITMPAVGYYSAAKHALQGFHETLASELDPGWNVKITILVPGVFRTAAVGKTVVFPHHPAYTKPNLPSSVVRTLITNPDIGSDALKAAQKIVKLSDLAEPPAILFLVEASRPWSDDLT